MSENKQDSTAGIPEQAQQQDNNQEVSKPNLCLGNCGFFGHSKTSGYCSKCFKDSESKEEESSSTTATSTPEPAPTPTPTPTPAPAPAPADDTATPSTTTAAGSASIAAAAGSDGEKPEAGKKKVQKKKNRCWSCKRKVGVLGFECRCEYVFCAKHRLPHEHDCDVDLRQLQQEKLRKQNPVVKHSKLERI